MSILEIVGIVVFSVGVGVLFWKGYLKTGIGALGLMFGYLVSEFTKTEERERKPSFKDLTPIEKEIKEAKKAGDEAVLATVPEPTKPETTRPERWKNL